MTVTAFPSRRSPGPIIPWTGESIARQTTASACQREIDRAMKFPPTPEKAREAAEACAKAATQLLMLRDEMLLTVRALEEGKER